MEGTLIGISHFLLSEWYGMRFATTLLLAEEVAILNRHGKVGVY